MTDSNDPRNIFFNHREEFSQPDPKQQATDQPSKEQEIDRLAQQAQQQDSYQQRVQQMKDLAQKYQREGEGQLVRDIVNNVIEQKAAGKLTDQQLLTFAKRVSPLLNADQKQRLDDLVEQLIKL